MFKKHHFRCGRGCHQQPHLQRNTIPPTRNTSYQNRLPRQQDKDKKSPVTIHSSKFVPQPSDITTRIPEPTPVFAHLQSSPINQVFEHFGFPPVILKLIHHLWLPNPTDHCEQKTPVQSSSPKRIPIFLLNPDECDKSSRSSP